MGSSERLAGARQPCVLSRAQKNGEVAASFKTMIISFNILIIRIQVTFQRMHGTTEGKNDIVIIAGRLALSLSLSLSLSHSHALGVTERLQGGIRGSYGGEMQ